MFLSFINRPAVLEYGMWDQIRVDHGNEFYLLLYVQEKMANYRTNLGRVPFIQTMSKEVSLYVADWKVLTNESEIKLSLIGYRIMFPDQFVPDAPDEALVKRI